jgi:hypothetical protein
MNKSLRKNSKLKNNKTKRRRKIMGGRESGYKAALILWPLYELDEEDKPTKFVKFKERFVTMHNVGLKRRVDYIDDWIRLNVENEPLVQESITPVVHWLTGKHPKKAASTDAITGVENQQEVQQQEVQREEEKEEQEEEEQEEVEEEEEEQEEEIFYNGKTIKEWAKNPVNEKNTEFIKASKDFGTEEWKKYNELRKQYKSKPTPDQTVSLIVPDKLRPRKRGLVLNPTATSSNSTATPPPAPAATPPAKARTTAKRKTAKKR